MQETVCLPFQACRNLKALGQWCRSPCSPDKWSSEPVQSQDQDSWHPATPPHATTSKALPAHRTSGGQSERAQQTRGCGSLEIQPQFPLPSCPESAWPQRCAAGLGDGARPSHHPVVAAVVTVKGSAKCFCPGAQNCLISASAAVLSALLPAHPACNRSLLHRKPCPG